jgi:hypothetical protein
MPVSKMRVFTLPVVGIFCGYLLGMGELPSLGKDVILTYEPMSTDVNETR